MEQAQTKITEKGSIKTYLWQNILAFVLSILGPMFFLAGLPPFIMSIMGMLYSRQVSVFEKQGNTEKATLCSEMAGNYARFSIWWMFFVYLVALIAYTVIQMTMPEMINMEVMEIITPMHGKMKSIVTSTN